MAETRDEIIKVCGEPKSITNQKGGFCAYSFEEDCFLAGGGRYAYDERLEYEKHCKYHVVYLKDKKVIKTF